MSNTTLKNGVFKLVRLIPKGKVSTYGRIAKILKIKSARPVGQILHRNKDPESVPCHRVVFADGSLSKNYGLGGEKKQRERLKNEGVIFLANEKVDLEKSLYKKF